MNVDCILGEDGTTNRFHLIQMNVKIYIYNLHLLSLNPEMKQHKKEMVTLP